MKIYFVLGDKRQKVRVEVGKETTIRDAFNKIKEKMQLEKIEKYTIKLKGNKSILKKTKKIKKLVDEDTKSLEFRLKKLGDSDSESDSEERPQRPRANRRPKPSEDSYNSESGTDSDKNASEKRQGDRQAGPRKSRQSSDSDSDSERPKARQKASKKSGKKGKRDAREQSSGTESDSTGGGFVVGET